ncbi:MAG: hypothetical protein ACE5IR_26725 [bacterium]
MNSSIALIAMCLLMVGSCAAASEVDSCSEEFRRDRSLSAELLVSKASFVGLYRVIAVDLLPPGKGRKTAQHANYTLSLQKDVMKNSPQWIELKGLLPHERLPFDYLATTERHSSMSSDEPTKLGSTILVYDETLGGCRFMPRFLVDAEYLVFGGVGSSVSYEFIADSRVDKWFELVGRLVNKDRSTDRD